MTQLLMCLLLAFFLTENCFASQSMLTWATVENSRHNLYLSQEKDGNWSEPIILASNDTPIILPTLIKNSNNDIWVVWTALDKNKNRLQYRHFNNGQWGEITGIQTSTKTDMAPSLQVDDKGVAWLVWAGVNGDDDIYYAYWNDGGWTVPQLLNIDDSWPDILPRLYISEKGQLQVQWLGYNGKSYVNYESVLEGGQWTADEELPGLAKENDFNFTTSVSLPQYIDDLSQAALYLENSNGMRYVLYRDQLK